MSWGCNFNHLSPCHASAQKFTSQELNPNVHVLLDAGFDFGQVPHRHRLDVPGSSHSHSYWFVLGTQQSHQPETHMMWWQFIFIRDQTQIFALGIFLRLGRVFVASLDHGFWKSSGRNTITIVRVKTMAFLSDAFWSTKKKILMQLSVLMSTAPSNWASTSWEEMVTPRLYNHEEKTYSSIIEEWLNSLDLRPELRHCPNFIFPVTHGTGRALGSSPMRTPLMACLHLYTERVSVQQCLAMPKSFRGFGPSSWRHSKVLDSPNVLRISIWFII
jgi:hypothetical protein